MTKQSEIIKKAYSMVCELQDNFNRVVNKNWKEERHLQDWAVAVFDESAEILGSLPWKWWKKMNIDIDNIKVELVDIFHFVLSQLIQIGKVTLTDSDVKTITEIYNSTESFRTKPLKERIKEYTNPEFIRSYTANLNSLVTQMFAINKDHSNSLAGHIIFVMFNSLVAPFMTFDELIKLYIGKNALNKIRQDFGYKKGEYNKIWKDGKEDNKVMQEIVKNLKLEEDVTFENVYKLLKDYYLNEVKGGS